MNQKLKKVYEQQVNELARRALTNTYHSTLGIANSIYYDILRVMRDAIDEELANK